jgi:hypothetical protein
LSRIHLIGALGLALVACNGRDAVPSASAPQSAAAPQSATAPRSAAAPQSAAAPRSGAPTRVALESAGAEPRAVARLSLQVGQSQTIDLVSRIELESRTNGQVAPESKVPSTLLVLEAQVAATLPDGAFTVTTVVRDARAQPEADVKPESTAALDDALKALVGQTRARRIDAQGASTESALDGTPRPAAQVSQLVSNLESAVDHFSVPFPTEAIGLGAVWTVTEDLTVSGVSVVQSARYEVVSREGARITLKLATEIRAGEQPMAVPGLPGGQVKLKSMSSTGQGQVEVDLSRVFPVRSTLRAETRLVSLIAIGDQANETEVRTVTDVNATAR